MECGLAVLIKPCSAGNRTCLYLLFVYVSLFLIPLMIFLLSYHRTTSLMLLQSAHGENSDIRLKFTQVLNGTSLEVQLELVDAFHAAMNRAAVPYFIYSGTLLGSWRHHGLVPWDDDVDVAVPISRQQEVQRVLDELSPRYCLNPHAKRIRWKFFSSRSHSRKKKWAWPYIDISFYNNDTSHVWDNDPGFAKIFKFRYEDVFPLRERPFMNRMLPAPVNTEVVLKKTYDLDLCSTASYDHEQEKFTVKTEQFTLPCKELESMHAFVHRMKTGNNTCSETLVLNAQVIGWFLRDFGTC